MNIRRLLLFIAIAVITATCQLKKVTETSPAGTIPKAPKSNRAKLLVQKEKKGTETGVYQQKLELREPLTINGKKVSDRHRFELSSTANYPGDKPACISERSSVNILHEKSKKSGWQYLKVSKVVWVVDGQKTSPEKIIQSPIEFEDGEWWESLITRPSCTTFQQLATAKTAELHIDGAVLKLSDEEIVALKDFTTAIGY